jgi:hypothetical protein
MFDSGVLDVAIGLIVLFILVSTVCTAIREGIESVLKTRAAYLEYAIRELLNDRKGEKLAKSFFQHPVIFGLFQSDYRPRSNEPTMFARGGSLPSYIPARSFAVALLDIVVRGEDVQASPSAGRLTFERLRARVEQLSDPFLQRALTAAIDAAGDDLDRLRKNIENWFDASMDRVSGWYKRSTQAIIFGVALAVVFALNLNAITIADALYRDRASRTAVTAIASPLEPGTLDHRAAIATLDRMHLPIGWNAEAVQTWRSKLEPLTLGAFFLHIVEPLLGLLLTAFAATLGAPFWFDVLNKVMVIRATVKPHEKSPEEASEDRQLPARAPASGARASSDAPPGFQDGLANTPVLSNRPANANDPHGADDADDSEDGCVDDGEPTSDEALPLATGGVMP